jgi:hypothetical protein
MGLRADPPATGRGASAPGSEAGVRVVPTEQLANLPPDREERAHGAGGTARSPRQTAAPAEGSRLGCLASAAPTRPRAGSRGELDRQAEVSTRESQARPVGLDELTSGHTQLICATETGFTPLRSRGVKSKHAGDRAPPAPSCGACPATDDRPSMAPKASATALAGGRVESPDSAPRVDQRDRLPVEICAITARLMSWPLNSPAAHHTRATSRLQKTA